MDDGRTPGAYLSYKSFENGGLRRTTMDGSHVLAYPISSPVRAKTKSISLIKLNH